MITEFKTDDFKFYYQIKAKQDTDHIGLAWQDHSIYFTLIYIFNISIDLSTELLQLSM